MICICMIGNVTWQIIHNYMHLHNFFILTFSKIFRRWYGFLFGTDSKILFFLSDTLIMQKLSTVIHILNGIKMVEISNGNEKKRKKNIIWSVCKEEYLLATFMWENDWVAVVIFHLHDFPPTHLLRPSTASIHSHMISFILTMCLFI